MKKRIFMLLTLMLAVSMIFAGCGKRAGKKDQKDGDTQEETEEEEDDGEEEESEDEEYEDDGEIPVGDPSGGPVSGKVYGYDVSILSGETLMDEDDNPVVRFYFDFTNSQNTVTCPNTELMFSAYQDGIELDQVWLYEKNIPEDDYYTTNLAPGLTIRATQVYSYDPDGGTLTFRVYDLFGEENLYYYTDPKKPQGAPSDSFAIKKSSAGQDFLNGKKASDDSVKIVGKEMTKGYENEDILRVFFEYTNNTQEAKSFFLSYTVYPLQDGYELPMSYAVEETPEDQAKSQDIEPGETVKCALCFEPHSDSDVAIVIQDTWGENDYFGEVVSLE